jgi:hypothetical protein
VILIQTKKRAEIHASAVELFLNETWTRLGIHGYEEAAETLCNAGLKCVGTTWGIIHIQR